MVQNEAPYDPYIPSGSNGAQGNGQNGNQRTAALQAVSCTPRSLDPWRYPFHQTIAFTWPGPCLVTAVFGGKCDGWASVSESGLTPFPPANRRHRRCDARKH